MSYIEREAFLDRLDAVKDVLELDFMDSFENGVDVGISRAMSEVENFPAADVRPVVLCRDCLHYEMGACLKIYDDGAANKDAWQERKPEDFCSRGEKREES